MRTSKLFFFAPIALQGAVTLVTIPIVIHEYGITTWSSIAVGQSIGGIGLTLFSLGWGFTGPTLLARLDLEEAQKLLALSFATKATAAVPAVVLMLVSIRLLGSSDVPLAFLSAVATASVGFSATWFFVGLMKPLSLLFLDALPRAFVMIVGALGVLLGGPVALVPLAQIAGTLVAVSVSIIGTLGVRAPAMFRALSVREVLRAVGRQSQGVGTAISSAGFANAGLPLVSVFLPALTPGFALVDKVQKQLIAAMVPIGSIVVSGMVVGLRTRSELSVARESSRLLLRIALLSVVASLPLTWLLLSGLSLNSLTAGWAVIGPLAVLIGVSFISGASPAAVLAPLRRLRRGIWAVSSGGVVGVSAALGLGSILGLSGIVTGLLVGQGVAVAVQWVGVVFGRRGGWWKVLSQNVEEGS